MTTNDPMPNIMFGSEWPHGLRCMDCHKELTHGQFYSERLTGFTDETPVCEIVCVDCALPTNEVSPSDS